MSLHWDILVLAVGHLASAAQSLACPVFAAQSSPNETPMDSGGLPFHWQISRVFFQLSYFIREDNTPLIPNVKVIAHWLMNIVVEYGCLATKMSHQDCGLYAAASH